MAQEKSACHVLLRRLNEIYISSTMAIPRPLWCCLRSSALVIALGFLCGLLLFKDRPSGSWDHISVKKAAPRPSLRGLQSKLQNFTLLAGHDVIPSIFDLGFNNGDDTALYLQHGYRVVAVEANPILVEMGKRKFARAIAAGRLKLLSAGIASGGQMKAAASSAASGAGKSARAQATLPFYVNRAYDIWASFHKDGACRDAAGTPPPHCEVIDVPVKPCSELFAEHGVPWMLKLDFEDGEAQEACVATLHLVKPSQRPRYIIDSENDHILTLMDLGYTRFKIVCQTDSIEITDWGHSSGPFGEFGLDVELGWRWRVFNHSKSKTKEFAADMLRASRKCGWWDIHAARSMDSQGEEGKED